MKVLQVNVNAASGSTGKIVSDIKSALEAKGHECLIAYGANETVDKQDYVRICSETERQINAVVSRITGVNHGCFGFLSTPKLIKLINRENPDIVHLQCPNGFIVDLFRILDFLGRNKIKTVVTNHAEYFFTGTCGHSLECPKWLTGCGQCPIYRKETHSLVDRTAYSWRQMGKSFSKFQPDNIIITSVSPWLSARAAKSPFMSRFRHKVVINGLDTSIFHLREIDKTIAAKFDKSKKLVLFVSASFDNSPDNFKGGDKIMELARKMPDTQFIVVATHNKIIETVPENVVLWGRTKSQSELAKLYSLADCSVIASKRETFSMVTAESLCCGTPIVGFKAGGPESIAINEYSDFVEYGNLEQFESSVRKFIGSEINKQLLSNIAREKFSKEAMTNGYLKVYTQLLK